MHEHVTNNLQSAAAIEEGERRAKQARRDDPVENIVWIWELPAYIFHFEERAPRDIEELQRHLSAVAGAKIGGWLGRRDTRRGLPVQRVGVQREPTMQCAETTEGALRRRRTPVVITTEARQHGAHPVKPRQGSVVIGEHSKALRTSALHEKADGAGATTLGEIDTLSRRIFLEQPQ